MVDYFNYQKSSGKDFEDMIKFGNTPEGFQDFMKFMIEKMK